MYKIYWFTGLPCSGKTYWAKVYQERYGGIILDGDELRNSDFSSGVGFSPEDRKKHLLRVGYMASLLVQFNNVFCSFVSPDCNIRDYLKEKYGIIEVFIDTPLHICEARDTKGLYKKARSGEIKDFTGVSSGYDIPLNPDIVIKGGDK